MEESFFCLKNGEITYKHKIFNLNYKHIIYIINPNIFISMKIIYLCF